MFILCEYRLTVYIDNNNIKHVLRGFIIYSSYIEYQITYRLIYYNI